MPTATFDGTILSILAIVIVIGGGLLAWMVRRLMMDISKFNDRLISELHSRTKAMVDVAKVLVLMERDTRIILDAVSKLTQDTIARERQRRRDD